MVKKLLTHSRQIYWVISKTTYIFNVLSFLKSKNVTLRFLKCCSCTHSNIDLELGLLELGDGSNRSQHELNWTDLTWISRPRYTTRSLVAPVSVTAVSLTSYWLVVAKLAWLVLGQFSTHVFWCCCLHWGSRTPCSQTGVQFKLCAVNKPLGLRLG